MNGCVMGCGDRRGKVYIGEPGTLEGDPYIAIVHMLSWALSCAIVKDFERLLRGQRPRAAGEKRCALIVKVPLRVGTGEVHGMQAPFYSSSVAAGRL